MDGARGRMNDSSLLEELLATRKEVAALTEEAAVMRERAAAAAGQKERMTSALQEAREQINALRGGGQAQRRERSRMRRNHDGAHAQRLGQLTPEERSSAAEREQGHPPGIEPARDADPLERPRHHRCGHRHDAGRDPGRVTRLTRGPE